MTDSEDRPADEGTLLFGAGFVFGVAVTLLIQAAVLVTVANVDGGLPVTVAATVAGGVVFAGIVGAGLYYLASPANRGRIAVDPALFGLGEDEE